MGGDGDSSTELYETIADALHSRTFDAASFSFLLIELLHRHEDLIEEGLNVFLPICVWTLTGDRELSEAARKAFAELGPRDEQ
jgi:hypothetical protein